MVCQDVAVLGVNDDARSRAGNLALSTARYIGQPEKAAKRLVAEMATRGNGLADADVDDGRRHFVHERGQAGQFLVVDHGRESCPCRCRHKQQQAGSEYSEVPVHLLLASSLRMPQITVLQYD